MRGVLWLSALCAGLTLPTDIFNILLSGELAASPVGLWQDYPQNVLVNVGALSARHRLLPPLHPERQGEAPPSAWRCALDVIALARASRVAPAGSCSPRGAQDLPSEFDVIVIGTGLTESLVAAAAARATTTPAEMQLEFTSEDDRLGRADGGWSSACFSRSSAVDPTSGAEPVHRCQNGADTNAARQPVHAEQDFVDSLFSDTTAPSLEEQKPGAPGPPSVPPSPPFQSLSEP